jgi:hypothetical protein
MTCATCHEPGRDPAPAEKTAFYNAKCLACHNERSCGLAPAKRQEAAPGDDCRARHMPAAAGRDAQMPTDHRIRARPWPRARGQARPPASLAERWAVWHAGFRPGD